jgi:hypothetical protein
LFIFFENLALGHLTQPPNYSTELLFTKRPLHKWLSTLLDADSLHGYTDFRSFHPCIRVQIRVRLILTQLCKALYKH